MLSAQERGTMGRREGRWRERKRGEQEERAGKRWKDREEENKEGGEARSDRKIPLVAVGLFCGTSKRTEACFYYSDTAERAINTALARGMIEIMETI
jgi:hypothetical protein